MENFRTVLPRYNAPFSLTHDDSVAMIGSCFTEHIGKKLGTAKFELNVNPNGILYNPASIGQSLSRLLAPEPYNMNELFQLNELWHSWEHHGHCSAPDPEVVAKGIDRAFQQSRTFLTNQCSCLVITLGSAQVFRLKSTGQVVANNHKAPSDWFTQERLTVDQVLEALIPPLKQLIAIHPRLKLAFTVSPVRHTRMGFIENQRSKSTLLLACAELENTFANACYFPAFELMMDDLRDYRFYNSDMLHPSDDAVDYIWDYFCNAFFPEETQRLVQELEKLHSAFAHRPFHPDTAAHRKFASAQLKSIEAIRRQYPRLNFAQETAHFEKYLNK